MKDKDSLRVEWKRFLRFSRLLIPFWKREAFVLFLGGLVTGLSLLNPYLAKLIIDRAYADRNVRLFVILTAIAAVIFILSGILNSAANYLSRYIRLRLNFNLNCRLFRKLQGLPYSFFQDTSTGQHLFKISRDIEQVSRFICEVLPQGFSLIPRSVFILVIIFFLDKRIALFSLTLAPFLYFVPAYFSRRLKSAWQEYIQNSGSIFTKTQEILLRMQLIKVFGKGRYHIRKYIESLIRNIRFGLNSTRIELKGSFAAGLVNRAIFGLIIFYGGYQLIKGRMTLGTLSAIGIYLSQLSGMQGSLAQLFYQISIGLVSCQRLESILDAPIDESEDKNAKDVIFRQGGIEFRNVDFSYNNKNDEALSCGIEGYGDKGRVLKNLNFSVAGGSFIGLVGPSGCGKTTITNLILRCFQPQSGEVLIDGCDIRMVKSKSLYAQIGAVLQEPYLWDDTIENNIRYAKPQAGPEEIRGAARLACIDEFIKGLPSGYATVIGENACKISEGQKQRIAIARALIKKPQILILDEALSSVDSETEDKIIDNIRKEFTGSTLIIVSHRFSTARKMDLVYFLQDPSTMKIGTHEELMSRCAAYKELFASQIEDSETILR